jgi:hypothetical protein
MQVVVEAAFDTADGTAIPAARQRACAVAIPVADLVVLTARVVGARACEHTATTCGAHVAGAAGGALRSEEIARTAPVANKTGAAGLTGRCRQTISLPVALAAGAAACARRGEHAAGTRFPAIAFMAGGTARIWPLSLAAKHPGRGIACRIASEADFTKAALGDALAAARVALVALILTGYGHRADPAALVACLARIANRDAGSGVEIALVAEVAGARARPRVGVARLAGAALRSVDAVAVRLADAVGVARVQRGAAIDADRSEGWVAGRRGATPADIGDAVAPTAGAGARLAAAVVGVAHLERRARVARRVGGAGLAAAAAIRGVA